MKYVASFLWVLIVHIFFVTIILFERIYAVLYCFFSILWNIKITKKSFRRLMYYKFGDKTSYWSNLN